MRKILLGAAALALMVAANAANAKEQTVKLKLENFYCASCAFIIQRTLAGMPGVAH